MPNSVPVIYPSLVRSASPSRPRIKDGVNTLFAGTVSPASPADTNCLTGKDVALEI